MPDEPTLGEVNRSIMDVKADIRAMRGEVMRADVYAANRSADEVRLKAVEADLQQMQDDRASMRRLVYGAIATAVGSAAVQGLIALATHKT